MADSSKHNRRGSNPKIELASEVSLRVQIQDVQLLSCSGRRMASSEAGPGKVSQNLTVETDYSESDRRLHLWVTFSLRVRPVNGTPVENALSVEATYILTYSVSDGPLLSSAQYEAFGQRNGVYNIWPYWREFVQSTTARMGLPPLVLPVYRVGASRYPASIDGSSSSAKLITKQSS